MNDIDVSFNLFESATAGLMQVAISLDDGDHQVKQATWVANSAVGVATMFGVYPPGPMLIDGNRGAQGVYSCVGKPNGQLTEQIGAMALQRDGGSGVVGWIK